ncbi:MAG: VOC family protein [Nitrososphaerales archaeon]
MAIQDLIRKKEGDSLTRFSMPGSMKLGPPTLRIKDLDKALDFYQNDLGLRVIRKYNDRLDHIELGFSKTPLVVIKHDPDASRPAADRAGLYHYAILVPDRKSLASTFVALGDSGVPYEGFADHKVSEALYLRDVEWNGIEIYADRPREVWPNWKELSDRAEKTGDYQSIAAAMSAQLDFDSLLRELTRNERTIPVKFPRGASIGHMHLRVTDLERSVKFYHEKLGLAININSPSMGAAFLSAGGYHHHIGLNTWHSLDGSFHKEGDAGLEELKIIVPENVLEDLESAISGSSKGGVLSIRDPDGIKISVESGKVGLGQESPSLKTTLGAGHY